ncbi:complement C1q tumor necrosis factor-related protein 3-like [Dreissena polymorpha]|nr:complement C1q tumor necrosis factor-related protein 3-like [Dreissena polymorpha]
MATFLTLVVYVFAQFLTGHGFLLDDNSVTNLLGALQQEKIARSALQSEVETLRNDVKSLTARHTASQCNCPPSKAVAFSATMTVDISNLGESQPIIYDKVITNVGRAYDSRHGTFRAPVGGTYKFTFSVLQGTNNMWIQVELVKNGKVIGRVKVGDYGYWAIGTNIINTHLDAGDDVWVQHSTNQGSNMIMSRNGGYTMFTGHLVTAD